MSIWRLQITPWANNHGVDLRKNFIEKDVLGIGWEVGPASNWITYEKLGTERYKNKGDKGWWPAVNAIHNRMKIGDLCWTRDTDGRYYLGRIEGPWEYRANDKHGIVNIRPCHWIYIGNEDSVPGKVINSFNWRSTLQGIRHETVKFYSKLRFNREDYLPENEKYELSIERKKLDFFH